MSTLSSTSIAFIGNATSVSNSELIASAPSMNYALLQWGLLYSIIVISAIINGSLALDLYRLALEKVFSFKRLLNNYIDVADYQVDMNRIIAKYIIDGDNNETDNNNTNTHDDNNKSITTIKYNNKHANHSDTRTARVKAAVARALRLVPMTLFGSEFGALIAMQALFTTALVVFFAIIVDNAIITSITIKSGDNCPVAAYNSNQYHCYYNNKQFMSYSYFTCPSSTAMVSSSNGINTASCMQMIKQDISVWVYALTLSTAFIVFVFGGVISLLINVMKRYSIHWSTLKSGIYAAVWYASIVVILLLVMFEADWFDSLLMRVLPPSFIICIALSMSLLNSFKHLPKTSNHQHCHVNNDNNDMNRDARNSNDTNKSTPTLYTKKIDMDLDPSSSPNDDDTTAIRSSVHPSSALHICDDKHEGMVNIDIHD